MYEKFYQFREKPFSLLPDSTFLYRSVQHDAALTLLQYSLLNRAGFTVITGDVGCGKTTLIRYLVEHLETDITVGMLSNTIDSFGELLQWILYAFGQEFSRKEKIEYYQSFVNFVVREYEQDRRTVLIIDEAQNLSPEILEELRVLSNINMGKDQMLQLILVGQPQLSDTLGLPELSQFSQRVSANYFIGPLCNDEVREYIKHRITIVGGKPSMFRSDAFEPIARHSKGIPRIINLLCDTALVYAYAEQRKTIDKRIIDTVLADKFARASSHAPDAFVDDAVEPHRELSLVERLLAKTDAEMNG